MFFTSIKPLPPLGYSVLKIGLLSEQKLTFFEQHSYTLIQLTVISVITWYDRALIMIPKLVMIRLK